MSPTKSMTHAWKLIKPNISLVFYESEVFRNSLNLTIIYIVFLLFKFKQGFTFLNNKTNKHFLNLKGELKVISISSHKTSTTNAKLENWFSFAIYMKI